MIFEMRVFLENKAKIEIVRFSNLIYNEYHRYNI